MARIATWWHNASASLNTSGTCGAGTVPLLVIDSWEHAYYLQYKNVKADWVKAFWNIANWQDAAARFDAARASASGLLLLS